MSEIDLNSDEVKAAIAEAVEEATSGLKAKNTELLGKLKKAQKDSAIDPADLERVESERDDLKTKLTDANKALGKATKDLEAANKHVADIDASYNRTLTDSALSDALTKAGVTQPVHIKAAKAMLASQLQVADDNGTRVVKAGDKAIGDFITEWAGTDEGKFFVTAQHSSGGGAGGHSGGGGKAQTLTEQALAMKASGT